jgi:4-diphosphocytidyl-2-C-methyl-D-erythritol kinase
MSGIGQKVWRPAGRSLLPAAGVAAVLVNPRVAVPTGKVFQALDARPIDPSRAAPPIPSPFADTNELIGYLRDHRNDLEAPARRIAPVIGAVLDALGDLPNALAARMSGSGATCLALFDDTECAAVAADIIASSHPNWWVVPTSFH